MKPFMHSSASVAFISFMVLDLPPRWALADDLVWQEYPHTSTNVSVLLSPSRLDGLSNTDTVVYETLHYVLESSSVVPWSQWTTVTNVPVVTDVEQSVTVDAVVGTRFYRLHQR